MGLCVRAAEGRPSCSVCAIQPDRPASSAMAMVDFSGVRDAIRVGQVSEALKDVASIRSLGGKNAKASGPCGVVCTGLLPVESLKAVAPYLLLWFHLPGRTHPTGTVRGAAAAECEPAPAGVAAGVPRGAGAVPGGRGPAGPPPLRQGPQDRAGGEQQGAGGQGVRPPSLLGWVDGAVIDGCGLLVMMLRAGHL